MMNYQTPSLEVVDFELVNVILASAETTTTDEGIDPGENGLPVVPNK